VLDGTEILYATFYLNLNPAQIDTHRRSNQIVQYSGSRFTFTVSDISEGRATARPRVLLSARAVLKRPVVVWRGYVCVTVLNRIGYLAKMLYPGQILKKTRVEQ
jgi:hypothetical protein